MRRATSDTTTTICIAQFLSTLSLRRATEQSASYNAYLEISIHALLAESDFANFDGFYWWVISIHALLAESDQTEMLTGCAYTYFYPRSPCGERRLELFLYYQDNNFYPRSPCGERQRIDYEMGRVMQFLSTLSLRRATQQGGSQQGSSQRFLSTLSLRRATPAPSRNNKNNMISIHALLAESDKIRNPSRPGKINFYPRSPCGERRAETAKTSNADTISIHALLAESDEVTF